MIDDPDAYLRARALLVRLQNILCPVVAEVGVNDGRMSAILLGECPNLHLYMVDSYVQGLEPYYTALKETEFAASRRTFLTMDSTLAAKNVPPLDAVFIDADHSYEAVKSDIQEWSRALKPGGLLSGHDYDHANLQGVVRAVTEFAGHFNYRVQLGPNSTWFIKLGETHDLAPNPHT